MALTSTDDDEAQLWAQLRSEGSSEAREKLFHLYQPLAHRLARQFAYGRRSNAPELGDIVQLASAGLLEAIDRYKPELGVPFRYFGNRRIVGSILSGIAVHSEVSQQLSYRNRVARERMASLRTKAVNGEDVPLADQLSILSEIAADLVIGLMLEDAGLARSNDRDSAHNAYETLAWRQMLKLLDSELDRLAPREQDVIRLHYRDGLSFDQIAGLLSLSKGRISQIHKAAVGVLRKRLSTAGQTSIEG